MFLGGSSGWACNAALGDTLIASSAVLAFSLAMAVAVGDEKL
jgi:hypothetical protein